MQVKGMNYYVSVSSFDKKQEANILIRVTGDEKEVKGSLRFNRIKEGKQTSGFPQ